MRNRFPVVAATVLALAVGDLACSPAGSAVPTYPNANVVLVTIDTLRADRLGAYGYGGADTPRLDALAAAGIRFDQVVSPTPLTLPAHTSLMTATEPYVHGVRDNADFVIPNDLTMLAEAFEAAGYDTGAFVGAYVLHSRWGLSSGFATYDDQGVHRIQDIGGAGRSERRADEVFRAARPWLLQERDRPFFGWIHIYDPHAPYEAPDPYFRRFADAPYDGEVAFTDSVIGDLVDELDNAGLLDNTIVLVTADHGEDLEDHGEPGHGIFLYDTTVRIPLILRLPDQAAAGTVVEAQVRLLDVGPTLLSLAGLEAPASFAGRSFASFFSGEGEERSGYSETIYPRWHFGWQELHALRKDGYKYVLAPTPELYDLAADPGELDNLEDVLIDVADGMRAELEALDLSVDDSEAGDMSSDAAQQLRALGYIGASPADLGDGPLPDPKDKIEIYAMIVEAESLLAEERFAEAAALLSTVIDSDPRIVDAHVNLAQALRATGDLDGAEAALIAALGLRPDYEAALSELGSIHRDQGDLETARADFRAVLALDPRNTNALFNLGELDMAAGSPASALRHFDQVIALYDEPASPRFSAGVAAYQIGDLDRAEREFEYVAGVAPDFSEVHYYRALVLEARDDLEGALEMYRLAIEHDPEDYKSLFNMAVILTDTRGEHPAAVTVLRRALQANPQLGRAYVYLGRSLVFLGDPATYPEAESALQLGLRLEPPPALLPMAHHTLAELYRRTDRPAAAQEQVALALAAERALGRR